MRVDRNGYEYFNKFANKIIIETISPKIMGENQECKKYTTDWRASLNNVFARAP